MYDTHGSPHPAGDRIFCVTGYGTELDSQPCPKLAFLVPESDTAVTKFLQGSKSAFATATPFVCELHMHENTFLVRGIAALFAS